MGRMTQAINFDAIEAASIEREPFDFMAIPNILNPSHLAAIRADFPVIDKPGLYPLAGLDYGPAFGTLLDDVQSDQFRTVIAQKFGIDLEGLPLMVTVRGMAQRKDGRIHADSKHKVITCLLYLNERWDEDGGRLRMLRSAHDLEDYAAEIPANGGSFAAFRGTPHAWHGHHPYVGERRYIMFNWIRSDAALKHHQWRHSLSARAKALLPFFYKGH